MSVLVVGSHEVRDYDSWKKGFDAHGPAREGAGLKLRFVGRDAANPNLVHMGFDAPSAEAARAFLGAPGLAEAQAAAGVLGVPQMHIVELA